MDPECTSSCRSPGQARGTLCGLWWELGLCGDRSHRVAWAVPWPGVDTVPGTPLAEHGLLLHSTLNAGCGNLSFPYGCSVGWAACLANPWDPHLSCLLLVP